MNQLATSTREKIEVLEQAILAGPQVDLQTTHTLVDGIYARTIFIPAGTVLTGAAHKTDHINIMQGDIEVLTDDGMKRLAGHHVLPTRAGMKRAGYAHGDTWWTTVCHTHNTDLQAIEDELVEISEQLQTRNNELTHAPLKRLEK